MIVRHKKRPTAYTERQQLRHAQLPELHSVTRPPTLAQTTKAEILDADIGLRHDPVAQRRAEDYIKAALAFRHRQEERAQARRQFITPVAIRIALAADDEPDDLTMPDVVEALRPALNRFDG